MNDFQALNKRQRRRSDQWNYRLQWIIGTLASLAILGTLIAQIWIKYHVH